MNCNYKENILSYLLSFSFSLVLITYILRLPHSITGNEKLVDEYYSKNYLKNVPMDFIFVLIYLLLAFIVMYLLNIKEYIHKVIVVGIVTAILTGLFCYYFQANPIKNNFFSKWFNTVGYSSVIYDVILLVFIFIVYDYLQTVQKIRQ